MLTINGENTPTAVGKTVGAYLSEKGFSVARAVVERNGDILSKDGYDAAVLDDGDTVEIFQFVGGG